jgi:hypothetical protein
VTVGTSSLRTSCYGNRPALHLFDKLFWATVAGCGRNGSSRSSSSLLKPLSAGTVPADFPSPATDWTKAGFQGGARVDLPHGGGKPNVGSAPHPCHSDPDRDRFVPGHRASDSRDSGCSKAHGCSGSHGYRAPVLVGVSISCARHRHALPCTSFDLRGRRSRHSRIDASRLALTRTVLKP